MAKAVRRNPEQREERQAVGHCWHEMEPAYIEGWQNVQCCFCRAGGRRFVQFVVPEDHGPHQPMHHREVKVGDVETKDRPDCPKRQDAGN